MNIHVYIFVWTYALIYETLRIEIAKLYRAYQVNGFMKTMTILQKTLRNSEIFLFLS